MTFKVILKIVLRRLSSFIKSDELYIKIMYLICTGKSLDLKNPQTFTEKLQWLKLYDRHKEYTMMVDKYNVKEYVAKKIGGGGEKYIIPTLGVWDKFEDIDFNTLPNEFVLKCTHDSGGLVICKDKSKLDIKAARKKINKCLKRNYYWWFREYPYINVPKRIIAEEYMVADLDADKKGDSELKDYKFFCFNGVPKLCQVISDRRTDEKIDFFDMNWNRQIGLIGLNLKAQNSKNELCQPVSFETMKRIASILSKDIPFSRIDLYDICGKCYFGEITFFPAGGMGQFKPERMNYEIGKWLKLPSQ